LREFLGEMHMTSSTHIVTGDTRQNVLTMSWPYMSKVIHGIFYHADNYFKHF